MSAPTPLVAAPAAVDAVVRALMQLHADDSSHAQRHQAQQYCEQIKAQPQQCLAVSLALLSSPSLPESALAPARHFALHSLQHLITHSWNQLADAEKEYLKSQAINIVQNCSQLCGGVRFLKQTIARIVTEIALREWPQRWPNMLDVLFASCGAQVGVAAGATVTPAAGSDPAGTELLSLVLRNLSEEVTGGESSGVSSLPDQRRRDVQAGLMACMEQIFPWMTGALRSAVATFAANKQDAQALRNCRALLEALYAMMEFLPAKWLFEFGLIGDICSYLVQPDLFESLCDLLQSVSNRKGSTIDEGYNPQIVAMWDAVLNWMQSVQANKFAKQAEFTHKLLAILSNLTRYHSELLSPAQYDSVKAKELAVLGQLLNHRLQKISSVALELWVHLFRHHATTIIKPEYRQSLLTELLKIACYRLIKITADDFEEQEMESQEEYNQFFGVYRGALLQLITLMAEMEPLLCFQVVSMRYQHLLGLPPPTDHLQTDGSGLVTMRTSRFLELEACGSLLECLFRSVGAATWADKAGLGGQLCGVGESLLRMLLAWSTQDPLLQTRRLHVLGLFVPILAGSESLFSQTVEALMGGVSFRPAAVASLEWGALSEDLKACRRRAIVSLIQLARRREQLVEPFFLPRFSSLVAGILSSLQAGRIAEPEKIALFEFLVLIAQSIRSAAEQAAFLNSILAEPIQTWTDAQMGALLAYGSEVHSQPAPFLQLLGLNPEDQATLSQACPASHRTATRDLRRKIGHTLHTFMAVFKPMFIVPPTATVVGANVQQPGAGGEAAATAANAILPAILPNVLRLLGHIYSIRSDRVRATLPPQMQGLLAPTPEQLLNPDAAASQATVAQVAPKHYHLLWDVRRWMDKVVDSSLNILMLAAKSGAGYYASLSQGGTAALYTSCLYSNLQWMHLREARLLLDKYVEALLNLCPPQQYLAVLMEQNVLPNILATVHRRLEQGWARVQASKTEGAAGAKNAALTAPPAGPSASSSSLSNEIHEESELRELSRCISENISRVIELQYVSLHTAHTAASTAAAVSTNPREKERMEKERRQQESQLLMQAPFCQLIFTQQPLLTSLYQLLIFLLGCPDSAASVRAIRLCHRLLPVCIGSGNPLALQLYARVFEAGLVALSSATQQTLDVIEMELIALIKDVYQLLGLSNLTAAPRQLLLALPNVTPADVAALDKVLATVCSEKKYRSAMRTFLDRHIKAVRLAAQSGAAGSGAALTSNPLDLVTPAQKDPKGKGVRDLEPLVLPARARAAKPDDEDDGSAVFDLFQ